MKCKKIIVFMLIAALVLPLMANMTGGGKTIMAAEAFERQTVNFNREWKFVRSNVEGAEQEDYNDTSWYNVGLPHDFSIPYWQEERHYTGYGWYRKTFDVKGQWMGKRITLDFEGVFHTAEIFVNGEFAGEHEGGYTGFEIDITDYVRQGQNTVAIRVNNLWRNDLAPRAGEHNFTGGIYRDVNLVITDPVHVTWYGTFVQTPEIDSTKSKVRMQTEVANSSSTARNVNVINTVYDSDKKLVATLNSDTVQIGPGEVYNFDDTSDFINNIKLWSPEEPNMYSVHTEVMVEGQSVDQYDTPLGFRWCRFDKDEGFFLNGEHYWIDGTNAHQDHAGWANAVTVEALRRDVAMVKEAGLNFIRGSHYPHSPEYSKACDEYGILFWSEAPFWCTATWGEGAGTGTSDDYKADGYPTTGDPATEQAFEQSCIDALTEMIRINRNHPSIIVWSMGNEPFFGTNEAKKQKLISKMAGIAKELDPTRATAMGGTQGGNFDHLPNVDIAGYNGDGAEKPQYQDPQVANLVSEYSTHTGNRPEKYTAYYGSVKTDENGEPIRYAWRSGIALWCAFHHGSIMSRGYGDMGFIDYYRLPLNIWYYYRNNRTGVEPEFSQDGTPSKLELTASDTTIKNDGTSDSHIIVTVKDEDGNWLNNEMDIVLEVVDGPGIFPTGKTMKFKAGDSMRDGKAAIEFRSYYAGETTIEAYCPDNPDIKSGTIKITTVGEGSVDEPDITTMYGTFMSNGGYVPNSVDEPTPYQRVVYKGSPMNASSAREITHNMIDNDVNTSWTAAVPGSGQWIYQEIEHGGINLYKARLKFKGKVYPYRIQYKKMNISEDEWITLKEYNKDTINLRPLEEDFGGVFMRFIRIEFLDVPANEYANIAELELYGIRADLDGYETGIKYLSEIPNGVAAVDNVAKNVIAETDSEIIYDLENDAERYARFQSDIVIDKDAELTTPVKFSVYCDEELMFEKTVSSAETVTSIDISINKVKQLKLVATCDTPAVKFSWSGAKLLGAFRDISLENSSVKTQICPGMDTLKAGEVLNVQARFDNSKNEVKSELVWSVLLNKADGTVVDGKIEAVSVPGRGRAVADIAVVIPDNVATLDNVKIVAWDKDTLIPVTETTYIFKEADNTMKAMAARASGGEKIMVYGKDAALEKVGNWEYWESDMAADGYETYVDTNATSASVSLDFTGTKVYVSAKFDGSQKGADIYIDGKLAKTVDTYISSGNDQYKIAFTSNTLVYGEHNITIKPTGKFGFDYIMYEEGGESDFSQLNDAINEYSAYSEANFQSGWKVFAEALAKAKEVAAKEATQTEIDLALSELVNAANALISKTNRNETGLKAAIKDGMNIIYNATAAGYTAASKVGYSDAMINGSVVLNDKLKSQGDVDNAEARIRNAISKLVPTSNNPGTPPSVSDGKEVLKKGKIYKAGKFKYKVIKKSAKKIEVAVKAPVSKKMKSAVIPATVKIKGNKCTITEIAAKAFAGNKNLKKIVIGKNIRKIGKKAFYKSTKLKNVIVKSKNVKVVAKDAFAGIKKKPVVKVPKNKLKVYKKLFKKVKVKK